MKIIILIISLFTAMFLMSCKSKKSIADDQTVADTTHNHNADTSIAVTDADTGGNLLFRINTSPCFGECPVYELTVMQNGEVYYTGHRFVELEGQYTAKISREKLEEIKARIKAANFFEFDETYDNPGVTDLPSVTTTIKIDGHSHTVTARFDEPRELKELNNYLGKLRNSIDLEPVEK